MQSVNGTFSDISTKSFVKAMHLPVSRAALCGRTNLISFSIKPSTINSSQINLDWVITTFLLIFFISEKPPGIVILLLIQPEIITLLKNLGIFIVPVVSPGGVNDVPEVSITSVSVSIPSHLIKSQLSKSEAKRS